MKNVLYALVCLLIAFPTAHAQKMASKVAKEETQGVSKSSNYGERTNYLITFKDGKSGKMWQAKSDGKWWGSNGLMDQGPFTKEEALKWLWNYKHPDPSAGAALGTAAGAALFSGKQKSSTPSSSKSKKTSINFKKKK